jgi:hypothetical protein
MSNDAGRYWRKFAWGEDARPYGYRRATESPLTMQIGLREAGLCPPQPKSEPLGVPGDDY